MNMANAIQVFSFNYEQFNIRAGKDPDGTPWVIGVDLGRALGHTNPERAVREYVDDEDKGVTVIVTKKGERSAIKVYEPGIYSMIATSQLPSAKQFKRWIFAEVLPSIRKTGTYTLTQPFGLPDRQTPAVRAKSKVIRRNETSMFKENGINAPHQYKNLTDTEYKTTFGMTTKQYREYKHLAPKENLRENFSDAESTVCQVADLGITIIMQSESPYGYYAVKNVVIRGANLAN